MTQTQSESPEAIALLRIEALRERIEGIPHLLASGHGDWLGSLEHAVELLEPKNNIDALWVWSRFLWAFGRRDTWKADKCLSTLMMLAWNRRRAESEWLSTPWYRWIRKRTLRGVFARASRDERTLLDYVLSNDRNWSDADDFAWYRGKVVG